MSTASAKLPASHAVDAPPPATRLRVWPLRDDGWVAWCTQGLVVLLALLAWACGGSWVLALLLAMCLELALWRMWIPATVLLDHRGIAQTVLGRTRLFPWNRVTKARVRRAGVLVLFDDDELPLGAFRGLYLRWLQQQAAILAQLEYYVPARVVRER